MSVSKTRQHLINVARELFATRGLETTTMNDIAVASQKGRRTLYTYFRSKEEVYAAVIASELERLSENLDQVAGSDLPPDEKIFSLIYTHLEQTKETVARNGSLKAEFFGNIADVERARRAFDMEEIFVLRRIISEGVQQGRFHVENVVLTADIIHYAIKGIEVPYILDRMGEGVGEEEAKVAVRALLRRALGVNNQP
ncbi:MAG: TetR/AcrR family transcriptional regulator [Bacteroidaceae bacterium]|nr:TetR/AcrR family transcriptional regulator [Bacteroidaceae bacterium]